MEIPEWEKICENHVSGKESISKVHQEHNSIVKKEKKKKQPSK
jgi:hypothetical protein